MKRSWDVIRAILMKLEEQPTAHFEVYPGGFHPIDEETAAYHMVLLHKAGLIEGIVRDVYGIPPSCTATGLTWEGHELLDTIRSQSMWARIRDTARQKGVDLSFEAVKVLAKAALESRVK